MKMPRNCSGLRTVPGGPSPPDPPSRGLRLFAPCPHGPPGTKVRVFPQKSSPPLTPPLPQNRLMCSPIICMGAGLSGAFCALNDFCDVSPGFVLPIIDGPHMSRGGRPPQTPFKSALREGEFLGGMGPGGGAASHVRAVNNRRHLVSQKSVELRSQGLGRESVREGR